MSGTVPQIIEVLKVRKSFIQPDKSRLIVLDGLNLRVPEKKLVVITGVSGSGKSTLLHLIGALDRPDLGEILFEGSSVLAYNPRQVSKYRNQQVGFVFQFHYLMPELNVLENTAFPFLLASFDREEAYQKAGEMLTEVGLKEKKMNMPYQLSGGERQRVAIARSLINSPRVLLADEPTGNLDYKTGRQVFEVFRKLVLMKGLTAVVVTHNEKLAQLADESHHLDQGTLCPG